MRPGPLYAVALVGAAALLWWASTAPPDVHPRDAAAHTGRPVAIEGFARDVAPDDDASRFTVAREGWGVPATAPGHVAEGSWVRVTGRVTSWQGSLRLHGDSVEAVEMPGPRRPPWKTLASSAHEWEDTPIELRGLVERRDLHGEGHAVALGEGAWPREGPVIATGALAYDARCLCHRFHAIRVDPWTP